MKGDSGGTWMWADLTSVPAIPAISANFHIEYVRNLKMLDEWKQVSAEGFGVDVQVYYDAYARHGFRLDHFSRHYIGHLDDNR